MICKFGRAILLLALALTLSPLHAAETPLASVTASSSAVPTVLKPGPDAGKIAFVTAFMMWKLEYLQHPFDATMSARMFDGYLTALDPQHMHFLQADLNEFGAYRTNLDRLTMKSSEVADTRPAYELFYRYMDRLREHVDFVDQALKTEKFDFTTEDRVTLDRRALPYPKNIDEAHTIWLQRLRYEYLLEKISRDGKKTNAVAAVKSDQATGTNSVADAAHAEKSGPPKTMREEITDTLSRNYHRTLKVFQEWDSSDVLNQYLESLARAYDPHSDYQGRDEYEDFAMQMNLSLFGIGAELKSVDGYCRIDNLLNGPAKASGKIKAGDRIVEVAQSNQPPVNIFEMPINKAVRLIRGPKDTEVRLTIIPANAPETTRQIVSLTRDEIKLENGEAKGRIYEVPNPKGGTLRLGLIDLPSFYATIDADGNPTPKSTSADVAHLLKKFRDEKVAGVMLDLRRNGGGSLEEAIRLAGLFIKQGPVVQIKRYDGKIEVRDDTDPSIAYDGPLVLLTSRLSASASEIVAGALQDYGRALIVGDTSTFGKGTAQQIFYLSKMAVFSDMKHDPGTLKLTNSKFYRASGASTEERGVAADVILPSLYNESTEVGEVDLDNHFPWDTIASSKFDRVNMVQAELAELVRRSSARTSTNKEFTYLRADIDRFRKQRADKTVSLSEKEQLAERAQVVTDHQQREKERASRKAPLPKYYEFTVERSALPGLPALTTQTNAVASADMELTADFDPLAGTRDGLSDALTSETEHAEAARLQEAKDILTDYITLLSEAAPKPAQPTLAK